MTLIEYFIWCVSPLVLAAILHGIFYKATWFNRKIIICCALFFGILGALLAPTAMCTETCNKVIAALILSCLIHSILLISIVVIMKFIPSFFAKLLFLR